MRFPSRHGKVPKFSSEQRMPFTMCFLLKERLMGLWVRRHNQSFQAPAHAIHPPMSTECKQHGLRDIRERFNQFALLLRERLNLVYRQGCGKTAIAAMLMFVAWAVNLLTRPRTQTTA